MSQNGGEVYSTPVATASKSDRTSSISTTRKFEKDASIILVGVRGAGKRSLGFIAATHLRWRFVTEGLYFEQVCGVNKATYLEQNGRLKFHQRNQEVFAEMLQRNHRGCIIECGMGSLTHTSHKLLSSISQRHPVVHITRKSKHIARLLQMPETDVERLFGADASHRSCSNYEFYNLYDCTGSGETNIHPDLFNPSSMHILQDIKVDFQQFVDFISARPSVNHHGPFSATALPLELRTRSCVVTLPLSAIYSGSVHIETIECGQDAVELYIDTVAQPVFANIGRFVNIIRRHLRVPIIFTISPELWKGSTSHTAFCAQLFDQAFRMGIEYVAVDGSLFDDLSQHLLQARGQTKLILHQHFAQSGPRGWLDDSRLEVYAKAKMLGYDVVRLTQDAVEKQDNDDVFHLRQRVEKSEAYTIPLCAYNLGEIGRTSIVFNPVLTPIKINFQDVQMPYKKLDYSGVAIREINLALFSCFVLDSLRFFVVGQSVAFSRGPAIHTAAYRLLGLQHQFQYREVMNFDDVLRLASCETFGGSAISFPYKEDAFRACTSLSPHAAAVGSINTLLPLRRLNNSQEESLMRHARHRNCAGPVEGLYGDNSDWAGFFNNIKRKISPRNAADRHGSCALVLGAGGSARSAIYALIKLGCQTVYVFNRTHENAVKLADYFNSWSLDNLGPQHSCCVTPLESTTVAWPQDAAYPSIIVACVPTSQPFSANPAATFQLPEDWLSHPAGGVVADISYNPPETPFLQQIRKFREKSGRPWAIVDGLDIVFEQAVLQFEQMTGYRAPRRAMLRALRDFD